MSADERLYVLMIGPRSRTLQQRIGIGHSGRIARSAKSRRAIVTA
jgi:hypothetical protein